MEVWILQKIKRRIFIFVSAICLMFVFTSCNTAKYTNFVEKFLMSLKEKDLEKSYTYLVESKELDTFREYMDMIINLKNTEGEFKDLSNLILDKVFGFNYEILDEEDKGDSVDVNVKIQYMDFSNLYKEALNDFLVKSLDFENIDNLYNGDYIKNILTEHINKIPRREEQLKFNIQKGKDIKIKFTEDMVNIFTGNFIDFFTAINKNIFRE